MVATGRRYRVGQAVGDRRKALCVVESDDHDTGAAVSPVTAAVSSVRRACGYDRRVVSTLPTGRIGLRAASDRRDRTGTSTTAWA